MMSMYLMMLYVTVEQEVALKSYFSEQGWFFKKPDMSVLTENLGGFVQTTMTRDITRTVESDQHPIERILNPTTGTVEYPEMSSVKHKAQKERISTLQAAKQIKVTNSTSTTTLEDISLHDVTESFVDGLVPKLEHKLEEICNKNVSVLENTVDNESDINNAFRTDVGLIQTINNEGKRVTVKEEPDISEDNGNVDDNDIQVEVMQDAAGDTNDVFGLAKEKQTSNRKKKEGRPKVKISKDEACICGFCGKKLASKSNLRQHEASRHVASTTGYHCCGKTFYSRSNLKRHRCSQHGEKKTHGCSNCGKFFATNADLMRHIRREEHRNDQVCDICGAALVDKTDFDAHMDKHKNKKSQMCNICRKTFRHRSSLSRHRKTHESKYGITHAGSDET